MSVRAENPTNRLTIDPLKYLNNLPEFCGDSGDLQTFTTLIDRIHPHLQTYDELSQQLFSETQRKGETGNRNKLPRDFMDRD